MFQCGNITNTCSGSQVDRAISPTGTSLQLHGAFLTAPSPSGRLAPQLSPPYRRKGAGLAPGALRSVKVISFHVGQTGRVAEQPIVRLLRL